MLREARFGSGEAIARLQLGDAFAGNGRVDHKDSFDMKRHGGRINVGFADGHVETFMLTQKDLDRVYIVPP